MTDVVIRILAVLGSGAGGALVLGLFMRLMLRSMTNRKPPLWSTQIVRLLGGVICAWLATLWLFGGGGSEIGGTGGVGLGTETGGTPEDGVKTVETGRKEEHAAETPIDQILRIEVLGRAALAEADAQAERWYRIETTEGPTLLTFAEIKEAIRKRQQAEPPLRRIEIVLYQDSPDERVPIVSRLRSWTSDRNNGKIQVDLLRPDTNAPKK